MGSHLASGAQRLVSELRDVHGIEFARVRRLLCRLLAGEAGLTELIESGPSPRQWTLEVLRQLGPLLDASEDRYRLRADCRQALADAAGCGEAHQIQLRPLIEEHRRRLPASLWRLDHVPATADTIARRAELLAGDYDLADRHLLCLGDHDLTSVAVTTLHPGVRATVVDVDEQILDAIASIAAERGLAIRCLFADLRIELPPSLAETADLVFTDPPYTPAGAELFLARGLAALRRDRPARVLFCYGYSDRQVKQGVQVQEALTRLGLAVEAVHPAFNRYDGADAIGRSSALWVCEPTKRSWSATRSYRPRGPWIYSRGRDAEEAAPAATNDLDLARLADRAAALIGAEAGPSDRFGPPQSLEHVLRSNSHLDHQGAPRTERLLLVDLGDQYAAYAPRLLLRAPAAGTVVLLAPPRALRQTGLLTPDDPVRRLLSSRYVLRADAAANPAVLVARWSEQAPPDASAIVARYVLDHPRAQVVHAWREGLIRLAADRGQLLTKNQARGLIEATGLTAALGDGHLAELPLGAIRRLVEGVELTAGQVT